MSKTEEQIVQAVQATPDKISGVVPSVPMQEPSIQTQRVSMSSDAAKAKIARRDSLESVGTIGGWQRAFGTSTTGHIWQHVTTGWDADEEADPDWKLGPKEYNDILTTYKLNGSEHVMKNLKRAESRAEAERRAQNLQVMQTKLEELEGHGFKTFLAHAADPIENFTMLAVGSVTGSVGAYAVLGARVGRVVHAAGQATALLGTMQWGERSGAPYEPLDYVVGSVMSGTITYGLANRRARQQRQIDANKKETAQGEAPKATSKEGTAEAPKQTPTAPRTKPSESGPSAGKRAQDIPAFKASSAPGVKVLREKMGSGETPTLAEVRTAFREVLQPMAAARLTRGAEKALKQEAVQLQQGIRAHASAPLKEGSTRALEDMRAKLDTIQQQLDAHTEAKAAQAELSRFESQGELPESWQALTRPQETPKSRVVDAMVEAGDSVDPAVRVPKEPVQATDTGAVPTAAEAPSQDTLNAAFEVMRAQKGMLGVPAAQVKKLFRFFTELVSEYDKLTAGIPELRAFTSRLLDDPLQRGKFEGGNAASVYRGNVLASNTEIDAFEKALYAETRKRFGIGRVEGLGGYSERAVESRLKLEREIAETLLDRNTAAEMGAPSVKHPDAGVQSLVEHFEKVTEAAAQRAKAQGLAGMENHAFVEGYFHRAWNYEGMRRMQLADTTPVKLPNGTVSTKGEQALKGLMDEAVRRGMPGLDDAAVSAISRAIRTRTINKAQDARTDFMGQLGKVETESILESLVESGADAAVVESVRRRLQIVQTDKTGVKYVKPRLSLDMTTTYTAPDGTVWKMADLIDTDVSRLLENYQQAMAGRGALAKVGIGGDELGISTWKQKYSQELDKHPLSPSQKAAMRIQMDHFISDFTGVRLDSAIASPTMQAIKALATASMLGSTGILQVAESGIIAARHGAVGATKALFKHAPGIKLLLKDIGHNPELYKTWDSVTKMVFSSDTRMRSWKRQHEVGYMQDGGFQRLAYAQQQLVPSITGQRWVHKMQSDMLLNENLVGIWKAANGDPKYVAMMERFGLRDSVTLYRALRDNKIAVTDGKGSLKELRLGALPDKDLEALTDVITRIQDSTLLAMRPGHGSSYSRTAVGQILGQFTSYVSMAHNKIMRATYEHEGIKGIAALFAYQYPLMLMITYVNELRKGNILDLDNDEDLMQLAKTALSYSAVVGQFGDVMSLLFGTEGRGGVAASNIYKAPGAAVQSLGYIFAGEPGNAASSGIRALRTTSIFGAIPGVQALEKTLKED